MSKFDELHKLKEEMDKDGSLPLKKGATKLVFGVGNTEASVLLIGEGPGYYEDQSGEPFVGQAGKLLDKLLILAGLERKKVFITNVVHHRPPENRDPEESEIKAYGKYLDKIIEIINPKLILTLGRFSMAKFLPNVFISSVHGKVFPVQFNSQQITVIPMYHPAASLRNGSVLRSEENDFLNLKEILPEILSPKSGKVDVEQESLI